MRQRQRGPGHSGEAQARAGLIACTLSGEEYTGRTEEAGQLRSRFELARHPVRGGLRLRFREEAKDELESLIEKESHCCAFLDMSLRERDGALDLTVTGPDDALPIIEELFA